MPRQRKPLLRPEAWPALLTPREAAEYLGMGESTLRRMAAQTRGLKTVVIGNMPKYRRRDLDEFIDRLPEGKGVCRAREHAVKGGI